jgi:hypothetical protein
LSRHDNQIAPYENIACVTVAARQSSPRRDRQIGQPVRRNASIQIVALQLTIERELVILRVLLNDRDARRFGGAQ